MILVDGQIGDSARLIVWHDRLEQRIASTVVLILESILDLRSQETSC